MEVGSLFDGNLIAKRFIPEKDVFLVRRGTLDSDDNFVLKIVKEGKLGGDKEILNLGLQCPYLVRINKITSVGKCFYVEMEYCDGGDLLERIENQKKATTLEMYHFVFEGCLAIAALHQAGVIHRDIKPANFFLKDGGFKLGDYGIMRMLDFGSTRTMTCVGTPGYISPEILEGVKTYTTKADVYSFGVTILHLYLLQHPFSNDNGTINMARIMTGKPIEAALKSEHPIAQMALRMISQNPDTRPNIGEVLTSLFPSPLMEVFKESAKLKMRYQAGQREITKLKLTQTKTQMQTGTESQKTGRIWEEIIAAKERENAELRVLVANAKRQSEQKESGMKTSDEAEKEKEEAEKAREEAAKAKEAEEKANDEADKAKEEAEKAKDEAEKAREEAAKAKEAEEKANDEAEKAKEEAEKAKDEAEKAREEAAKVKEVLKEENKQLKADIGKLKKENLDLREKNERFVREISTLKESSKTMAKPASIIASKPVRKVPAPVPASLPPPASVSASASASASTSGSKPTSAALLARAHKLKEFVSKEGQYEILKKLIPRLSDMMELVVSALAALQSHATPIVSSAIRSSGSVNSSHSRDRDEEAEEAAAMVLEILEDVGAAYGEGGSTVNSSLVQMADSVDAFNKLLAFMQFVPSPQLRSSAAVVLGFFMHHTLIPAKYRAVAPVLVETCRAWPARLVSAPPSSFSERNIRDWPEGKSFRRFMKVMRLLLDGRWNHESPNFGVMFDAGALTAVIDLLDYQHTDADADSDAGAEAGGNAGSDTGGIAAVVMGEAVVLLRAIVQRKVVSENNVTNGFYSVVVKAVDYVWGRDQSLKKLVDMVEWTFINCRYCGGEGDPDMACKAAVDAGLVNQYIKMLREYANGKMHGIGADVAITMVEGLKSIAHSGCDFDQKNNNKRYGVKRNSSISNSYKQAFECCQYLPVFQALLALEALSLIPLNETIPYCVGCLLMGEKPTSTYIPLLKMLKEMVRKVDDKGSESRLEGMEKYYKTVWNGIVGLELLAL